MQNLVGHTSHYTSIASVQFSPAFLQNHDPKLISRRFCKQRLSFLIDWYVIINDYLPKDAFIHDSSHVYAERIYSEIWK